MACFIFFQHVFRNTSGIGFGVHFCCFDEMRATVRLACSIFCASSQGISVQHGSHPLSLRQGLRQQGFETRTVVSYVYSPVQLKDAWSCSSSSLPFRPFRFSWNLREVTPNGLILFNRGLNLLHWTLLKSVGMSFASKVT